MGNNHDKYFGKDHRKILILGLPGSGKTNLLTKGRQTGTKNQKTKDLTIKDAKLGSIVATFFDLAGGQRQRIFWKQHYQGTQGIIFIINATESHNQIDKQLQQIIKLSKVQNLKGIPIAICLHKADLTSDSQMKEVQNRTKNTVGKLKINYKAFKTEGKSGQKLKEMITWLLKETKPL